MLDTQINKIIQEMCAYDKNGFGNSDLGNFLFADIQNQTNFPYLIPQSLIYKSK